MNRPIAVLIAAAAAKTAGMSSPVRTMCIKRPDQK
jgi:hypothetical protein